jgi:hypothetical protein
MTVPYIGDTAKALQLQTLLSALRVGPVSTIQARDAYGISSPAARIYDARRSGHKIITDRATVADQAGRKHTVARYRLETDGSEAP